MNATSMILKSDSRGRARTPPERREALLAEFDRSGVSATKFCAMVGVRYQTFATWLQKRRGETPAPARSMRKVQTDPAGVPEAVLRLVEAVKGDEVAGCVRIELPGGAGVELSHSNHAALVAALLRALESSPAPSC